MGVSDFLRRLSFSLVGWPKIDESSVLQVKDAASEPLPEKKSTPYATYCSMVLLSLMQDTKGLPGPKVIQEIGATLHNVFTTEDIKLAETDYGINYLWTQSIRVAAKDLVSRGLLAIAEKDLWQLTIKGQQCAADIYEGYNEAWSSYPSADPEPKAPEAANIVIIKEPPSMQRGKPCTQERLEHGRFQGTRLFCETGEEIYVPCPSFGPLGRTSRGEAYHRAAEIYVLAVWLILNEFDGTVPESFHTYVSSWYDGKLTAIDNEEITSRKTRFSHRISNLTSRLKLYGLISVNEVNGTYHVTEKGFTALVTSLRKHGMPG